MFFLFPSEPRRRVPKDRHCWIRRSLKAVLLRSGDGQLLLSNGDIIINSRTSLDKIMTYPNAVRPLMSVCWRNTGIPMSYDCVNRSRSKRLFREFFRHTDSRFCVPRSSQFLEKLKLFGFKLKRVRLHDFFSRKKNARFMSYACVSVNVCFPIYLTSIISRDDALDAHSWPCAKGGVSFFARALF